MSGAIVDPGTLAALRAAGISEPEALAYARREAQEAANWHAARSASRVDYAAGRASMQRPYIDTRHAFEQLVMTGSPSSLARAYVQAGASPRRIVDDLLGHACCPGVQLSAAAAALLERRLMVEAPTTSAAIWRDINARRAERAQ